MPTHYCYIFLKKYFFPGKRYVKVALDKFHSDFFSQNTLFEFLCVLFNLLNLIKAHILQIGPPAFKAKLYIYINRLRQSRTWLDQQPVVYQFSKNLMEWNQILVELHFPQKNMTFNIVRGFTFVIIIRFLFPLWLSHCVFEARSHVQYIFHQKKFHHTKLIDCAVRSNLNHHISQNYHTTESWEKFDLTIGKMESSHNSME